MENRQYLYNTSILTIKFGDIVDSEANVIVSSDDSYITMGGGVSKAILRAGGEEIRKDANKMVPVPLGNVAVTTAGNLYRQKYVFHCITIDRKRRMQIRANQVTEEDILNYILQNTIDKCFLLLQSLGLESIAFPAIGAGKAKIPFKIVVEQMSLAISRNLSKTNKPLKVELYINDVYRLYTESDYISLFECFASKAALVEYQKNLAYKGDFTEMRGKINENEACPSHKTMKHQVFISYSRKDKDIAEFLCELLKENNIEYWIDKEGIYSSLNYKEVIVDAIEISRAVIFLSSVNSNSSVNVIREIGYAVNMNKPILPLMLDDSQYAKSIRLDISDVNQIDFRNPMSSCKELITSLMYVLNK